MLHFLVPLLTVLLTADAEFTAMAVDGEHVYVGTADGEVHSSQDGGETWNSYRVQSAPAIPFRSQLRWKLSVEVPHLQSAYADAVEWPQVFGAVNYLRVHSTWDPGNDSFASEATVDPSGLNSGTGPRQMNEIAERSVTFDSIPTESGIPHRLHSALLDASPAIRRIVVNDGEVFAVASEEVVVSRDHGASWHPSEALPPPDYKWHNTIGGREVVAEASGTRRSFAATRHDVWEKRGDRWDIYWHGPRRAEVVAVGVGTRALFVLLGDQLYRLTDPEPWELQPVVLDRLRRETADEPSLDELVYEGLRSEGVLPEQLNHRGKARVSHLLPRLHADFTVRHFDMLLETYGLRFGGILPDGSFPVGQGASGPYDDIHWNVIGLWDLQEMIFDPNELPSQTDRDNHAYADWLRDQITAVYAERQRLQIARLAGDNRSLRGAVMRDARIEELTEQLNLLTNRLVDRYAEGVRIDAWSKN